MSYTSALAASLAQNPPVQWCTERWNRSRRHPKSSRTPPTWWRWLLAPQKSTAPPETAATQSGQQWRAEAPGPIAEAGSPERGPEGTGASGHRRWAPAWWRELLTRRRRWRKLSQCQTEEWSDHNLEEQQHDMKWEIRWDDRKDTIEIVVLFLYFSTFFRSKVTYVTRVIQ